MASGMATLACEAHTRLRLAAESVQCMVPYYPISCQRGAYMYEAMCTSMYLAVLTTQKVLKCQIQHSGVMLDLGRQEDAN